VTLGLVLLLLLVVYRAPILALLPLFAVGAAYLIAIGVTYLLIEAGAITVNVEGTMLLLVLIFGAGTDYSLLLIHRYREEIARGLEPAVALPRALAESARAIAASATTGDRGDADAAACRARVDPLTGTCPRDRDRGDARRRPHPPARDAVAAGQASALAIARFEGGGGGATLGWGCRLRATAAARDRRDRLHRAWFRSRWGTSSTTARSASARAKRARANPAAAPRSSTSTSRPASARH
jgi:MMPL family protein